MISVIEMSGHRLVNMVVSYGTKMFGKPVRGTSASLTDVEFTAFIARYAINDVGGGTCEICRTTEIRFGSTNNGGLT